jgi:guanosine-3',5'-bis(diphosphate) 3'-pyrophosphohydrolase
MNHLLEVVHLLCQNQVKDPITLSAAVLYNITIDTQTTIEHIQNDFGVEVATIIREVSHEDCWPRYERHLLQLETATTKSLPARLITISILISRTADLKVRVPIGWTPLKVEGYVMWSYAVCQRSLFAGSYAVTTPGDIDVRRQEGEDAIRNMSEAVKSHFHDLFNIDEIDYNLLRDYLASMIP